jgi:Flp pilus assembly pilin Flp
MGMGMTKGFVRVLIVDFVRDDSGQAFTEYILLLSISVTLAAALARGLIGALDTMTLLFGGQLEQDIKTGRASVSIWNN